MSFGFQAAGHRADVIGSLRNTPTHGNEIGTAVRDAIVTQLEAEAGKHAWDGFETVYVVKAGGHSGDGSPLSLSVTVESFYQAIPVHDVDVSGEPVAGIEVKELPAAEAKYHNGDDGPAAAPLSPVTDDPWAENDGDTAGTARAEAAEA